MKNALLLLGAVGVGYILNTDRAKKVASWACKKVEDAVDSLTKKAEAKAEVVGENEEPEEVTE